MGKHVYRPYDKVRIVTPDVFIRVGYPIEIRELALQLHREHGDKVKALIEEIAGSGISWPDYTEWAGFGKPRVDTLEGARELPRDGWGYSRVLERIAYVIAQRKGYGGNERSIYTETRPDLAGVICQVEGKKVVKTGTRFGASSWTTYEGEHEYDPGGLENQGTHVILKVYPWDDGYLIHSLDAGFWIEADHVEPVSDEQLSTASSPLSMAS